MAGEKASGLAFDAYFESHTGADADLCGAISSAAFPVLSGFSQQRLPTGLYLKRPITSALACLVPAHQGHLMGFADVDGRVRSIPV